MTPTFDEPARRRPDFAGGIGVTLCDGQTWTLAQPVATALRFIPGPKGTHPVSAFDQGPEYDELIDRFIEVDPDAEGGYLAQMIAQFEMAAKLLRRNYDLSPKEVSHLLKRSRVGSPDITANEAMWSEIAAITLGRPPKASPVGSELPSLPTG